MTHAFAMGTGESKAIDEVRSRLDLSYNRFGGQNEVFRQLNRYYLSLSPQVSSRDNDRNVQEDSRYPNLFVPRSFTAVEAATPPWIFAVLGGTPPVRVYARKEEYEDKADAVQRMIQYDWERSDVLYRSIHVAKQMFKYGTGIAKIGYKHDEYDIEREYEMTYPKGMNALGKLLLGQTRVKKKETVRRFDGPWLEPWSVYNFHPDPYYPHLREMRYVCARRWTDRQTLKLEDEQHKRFTGKSLYKHLDRIPRIKRGFVEDIYRMDYGDDLAEAMGWSGGYSLAGSRYTGSIGNKSGEPSEDLVEIIEYWSRDDRVVYLANGEIPILDAENPFDDKEIPFVASRCHVLDNQFWGYGILHPIVRTQEELNEHRNLMLRQAQLNIMNVWAYDEDVGLPPQLRHMAPGNMYPTHYTANGNPMVTPLLQGRPLPPEAYQMEDRMDLDMQTAIAMPQYRSGSPAGGGDTTATEAQIAAANVEARTRLMALGGELTYATEVARFFHSRRQQFLEDQEEFRILGSKGTEYTRMGPEEIQGEYDFVVAGTNLYASKDVLRQQLQQAISIIKGDPLLLELTDMPEVMEELWKMFDFQNPQRFLRPPRERQDDPRKENIILLAGEPEAVEATDDHEAHMQTHRQGFAGAVQSGNEKALQAFQDHMQQHQRYLSQQQAAPPPQEQPGIRGHEGNTPNLENAVESEAGIQARMRGAGQQI